MAGISGSDALRRSQRASKEVEIHVGEGAGLLLAPLATTPDECAPGPHKTKAALQKGAALFSNASRSESNDHTSTDSRKQFSRKQFSEN